MIKMTEEERKLAARESARKFANSEKGKVYRAEYNSRPEVIAARKEYAKNYPYAKRLAAWRKYNASEKGIKKHLEYDYLHPERRFYKKR